MDEENKAEEFYLYLDMGDALDQDQLDQLTRQLRSEMLDQNVEIVDLVRGEEVPEGSKAGEAITWGAIAIQVLPTLLPGVVEFLKSWTQREESRKVTVRTKVGDQSIELEYSSAGIKGDEINELVSALTAGMQAKSGQTTEMEEPAEVEPPKEEEKDAPAGEGENGGDEPA